jgi:hypothetical protein
MEVIIMSAYPDWVNRHKLKGTAVKKVGNSYYLYKVTSKRIPGMKYPQPIQSFLGTITRNGLVTTMKRKVSTETVRVYEYGFSYTLSEIVPTKFKQDIGDEAMANYALLNIAKSFSPDSYLLRGFDLPTMDELDMSLDAKIEEFEHLIGFSLKSLLPLSRIYLVETKECDMISVITLEMRELMKRAGVRTVSS